VRDLALSSLFGLFVATTICTAVTSSGQTVINVPPQTAPSLIDSNTTVNLLDGGTIVTSPVPSYFSVGNPDGMTQNAELNIEGGEFFAVASGMRVYQGGTLNVRAGELVGDVTLFAGADAHVEGGWLRAHVSIDTPDLHVEPQSNLLITGGVVDSAVRVRGTAEVTSGSIHRLRTRDAGSLELAGGAFGSIGHESGALGSATLSGGDFRLNGVPIAGLGTDGSVVQFDIPAGSLLSGVLADGSPFLIPGGLPDGFLTLQTVVIPPTGPALIQAATDPLPYGIRAGQTLIVDNGSVVAKRFTAGAGSVVSVLASSSVDDDFKTFQASVGIAGGHLTRLDAYDSEIELTSGRIHDSDLYQSSKLVMTGGEIHSPKLWSGSEALISGGILSGGLRIEGDSTAIVSGVEGQGTVEVRYGGKGTILSGTFWDALVDYDGFLDVRGGSFGSVLGIRNGGEAAFSGGAFDLASNDGELVIAVDGGGKLIIRGQSFSIDGEEVDLAPGQPFIVSERDVTLSGVLSDGSPFSFPLIPFRQDYEPYVSSSATLTITVTLPGDFDFDGLVNAADYAVWRDGSGGTFDQDDYNLWRANFGQTVSSGVGAKVPEPATLVLLLMATVAVTRIRQLANV
jgi:hypothetical protein